MKCAIALNACAGFALEPMGNSSIVPTEPFGLFNPGVDAVPSNRDKDCDIMYEVEKSVVTDPRVEFEVQVEMINTLAFKHGFYMPLFIQTKRDTIGGSDATSIPYGSTVAAGKLSLGPRGVPYYTLEAHFMPMRPSLEKGQLWPIVDIKDNFIYLHASASVGEGSTVFLCMDKDTSYVSVFVVESVKLEATPSGMFLKVGLDNDEEAIPAFVNTLGWLDIDDNASQAEAIDAARVVLQERKREEAPARILHVGVLGSYQPPLCDGFVYGHVTMSGTAKMIVDCDFYRRHSWVQGEVVYAKLAHRCKDGVHVVMSVEYTHEYMDGYIRIGQFLREAADSTYHACEVNVWL